MRRIRPRQRSKAAKWSLGIAGMYEYDIDPPGVLRNWEGSDREAQWHGAHFKPAYPLMGDPSIWEFKKTDDVSSVSWVITESGSGTQLTLQDERGGVAKFTNGASDNNYQFYFSRTELAQIQSSGSVIFNAQVKIADVDQADFFVGLCQRLASGNLFDNRVNSAGFYLADGSAACGVETRLASTPTQSGDQQTLSDDTWYSFGINIASNADWSVKSANFFIDGVYLTTIRTTMPTTEMCFAFGLRNGQAAANELSIKMSYILQN